MTLCFIHRELYRVVSVTGVRCWAQCPICRGRYLKHMVDVSHGLLETVLGMVKRGVRGVLISGGFDRDLTLPVRLFLSDLHRVRPLLKAVSIHLGLQRSPRVLEEIRRLVDVVDVEFVSSDRDSMNIRGVEARRYLETIEAMSEAGLPVVPHIFLWTPWRSVDDLVAELKLLKSMGFDRVALLVLMDFGEPPQRIVEWLSRARDAFDGELYLGCMRPRSAKVWLDRFAMSMGLVDRIANPLPRYWDLCDRVFDACCSIPSDKLMDFLARPLYR